MMKSLKNFLNFLFFFMLCFTVIKIQGCRNGKTSFEIVTGYAYTSPSDLLGMLSGILELNECLSFCLNNETCQAINFETGLCVLLSKSAQSKPDSLKPSQFPVFTIYAQKICLSRYISRHCSRAWLYEKVIGYKLKAKNIRKLIKSRNDEKCIESCIRENEFNCYSINYNRLTNECEMFDSDRHSINSLSLGDTEYGLQASPDIDYIENNCVEESGKVCEFSKIHGIMMKTVDGVYPKIKRLDECRRKCLQAPFRCNSFDLGGEDGNTVCRISHLSRAKTIHIQDPYLETSKGVTYELDSCYNVSLTCGAREMNVSIKMNKPFSGKLYALSRPHTCFNKVSRKTEMEISLPYKESRCGIIEKSPGHFINSIVLQHHSLIVTSEDIGITLSCNYDLSNRQVSHQFSMTEMGEQFSEEIINSKGSSIQEATVTSPTVIMRVTDRNGFNIRSAEVGDLLSLRFEIPDESNLYEIFVREVVADDGINNAEYTLIDANGCPTDGIIMGPVKKVSNYTKTLEAHFEAFKFPTSGIVQFRASVVPCLANCHPVECTSTSYDGNVYKSISLGRKRRRRSANDSSLTLKEEPMQFTQIIQIVDKFVFNDEKGKESESSENDCIGLKATIIVFIFIIFVQFVLTGFWIIYELKKRSKSLKIFSSSLSCSSSSNASSISSISKTSLPNF